MRFADFIDLVGAFGFEPLRTRGSHHVFTHRQASLVLNLQPDRGEAKGYQVRAFLKMVDRYDLTMEVE